MTAEHSRNNTETDSNHPQNWQGLKEFSQTLNLIIQRKVLIAITGIAAQTEILRRNWFSRIVRQIVNQMTHG